MDFAPETTIDFSVVPTQLAAAVQTTEMRESDHGLKKQVTLSVVVPSYNSADCLPILCARLQTALAEITDDYEIVIIDDCSKDNSWEILKELTKTTKNLTVHLLSRNFGQQAAISAGLSVCKGKWAIVMDCDLQDPPEDIGRLWHKANTEGYDIVMARRIGRKQSAFRQVAARWYFKILSLFSMANVEGDCGTFSIISRPVIDSYLRFADINRHYLMILQWLGFKRGYIEYKHADREAGVSAYSPIKLLKHALQGLFFQTTVLLQMIVAMGILTSVIGGLMAVNVVWAYVVHSALPGWTSIVVIELILGGLILLSLGVIGLYIGQIFDQVKERPLFIFSKTVSAADFESQ
jgi:polyisoprenyl-phosphate glycosyltransferase